jgi:tripartite-type tricarboxylate transporter receptor subunit TctC
VSNSERRKAKLETLPMASKSRRTQRRPVGAALLHRDLVRGNATELPRRRFLHLSAGAAVLPVTSRIARAQAYPTRPVRLIVPYAAGGGNDIVARLMGQWLSERLGQPFVIENRPGAGTNIGTEAVVRAPADGYTLLLCNSPAAINATLYNKLNFDFLRDITPVAAIARDPQVMVVNPTVPTKTIPDFIGYAKDNPGKTNMASAGNGSGSHMAGELFEMMARIDMVHVPYRGAALALSDLLGEQVQVMFAGMIACLEYIRSGHLRALAVTTTTRLEALPDIASLSEFLPDYEAADWKGIGVPRNTPFEIIDKLNKEIMAALTDPKITARLAQLGSTPLSLLPADFGKLIAAETEKWAKVIRAAHIKAE